MISRRFGRNPIMYGAEDWSFLWGNGPVLNKCYRYVYDNGCKSLADVLNALLCDVRSGRNLDLYEEFDDYRPAFERACGYNRLGFLREDDGELVLRAMV